MQRLRLQLFSMVTLPNKSLNRSGDSLFRIIIGPALLG
jgi:hypothetical protein